MNNTTHTIEGCFNEQLKLLLNYLDCFQNLYADELDTKTVNLYLKRFSVRINNTIHSKISFINLASSPNIEEATIFTMKLSEAWFAYEALIPFFAEKGFQVAKIITQKPQKTFNSLSEAKAHPKNFCNESQPYGKQTFYDLDKVKDFSWYTDIEGDLDSFTEYLKCIYKIQPDARKRIQDYLIYLENKSLGSQKAFLLESYNRLTNCDEVTPANIMSIAYAIRNQYVHDGEIVDTDLEHPIIKKELLKACYLFVAKFSLSIAMAVFFSSKKENSVSAQ